MLKKILKQAIMLALSLFNFTFYASESEFSVLAPPNSPLNLRYRRFRARPANPTLQVTQAPDLFIENINSPDLRRITERYPTATRITLNHRDKNTLLLASHIDRLLSLFPRLETIEVPSESIDPQEQASIRRLFPRICLVITQGLIQEPKRGSLKRLREESEIGRENAKHSARSARTRPIPQAANTTSISSEPLDLSIRLSKITLEES